MAPRWLRAIFLTNVVVQTGIVLTGGLVRLTASGLGCPTWPECTPGSFVPTTIQEQSWHKYVEFGNRLLTFVLAVAALAAIAGCVLWRRQLARRGLDRRKPLLWLALVPLVGTIVQAVLGGITVLTGLHPLTVAAHFLVSALLIAACVILYVRSREPADTPIVITTHRALRVLAFVLLATGFMVLVLGTLVTGTGPHAGDLAVDNRLPFDIRTITWMHADLVVLFIGLLIGLIVAAHVSSAPPSVRRRAWLLLAVSAAQGIIGYTQYFTGVPWLLVLAHLAGACAVWITLVTLVLATRTRGYPITNPLVGSQHVVS